MPEQQKDVQSQKPKMPPSAGGDDKEASGKMDLKQGSKKTGAKDDDEASSCGTGSCGTGSCG